MNGLFDKFTSKRRDFMVKEDNMVEVLKMFPPTEMNIGHAGESDLWFVHADITDNQWCNLLEGCANKKYKLVIKDVPNRMYFEKES